MKGQKYTYLYYIYESVEAAEHIDMSCYSVLALRYSAFSCVCSIEGY